VSRSSSRHPLPSESTPFFDALTDRDTVTNRAFLNPPTLMKPPGIFSRAVPRGRDPPQPTAWRPLAASAACTRRFPCGGGKLVDRGTLDRMSCVESDGNDDRVLLLPTRFALGFMKTMDNRPLDSARLGPNESAFGHVGRRRVDRHGRSRRSDRDRLRDERDGARHLAERARAVV